MKAYQTKKRQVNDGIEISDAALLKMKAAAGLLNLSMELGLAVVAQLLEGDVVELAGVKGKHNPNRTAYRHGTEKTKVVMGGGKVSVDKPRVRSKEGVELPLPTLRLFQDEDPLNEAVLNQLLCGVSTRKYERAMGTQDEEKHCTSKSEVSRRFIAGLQTMMKEFFSRRIVHTYRVIMIDGIEVGKTLILVAMGIDEDGKKQILGIMQGGSENHTVVEGLLTDLITRGLATDVTRLFVLDGGKALHKGVQSVFGEQAVIQRCQVHKKRNVLSYLPESERANASMLLSKAYLEYEYEEAKRLLDLLANNLDLRYPMAAASLREGMEETLTMHRLGIPGLLRTTLSNTNPIESANSVCMGVVRRISNWQQTDMILRNMAAGFMEAERGFRRVRGYRQMPLLSAALDMACGMEHADPSLVTALA